jgi:subtilisin family serine protease
VLLASAVLLALLVGQRPAAAQPVAPDAPGALAAVAEPLAQALAEQTGPVSFLAILDAQTLPADLLFAADASLVARRTAIYQQMTATAQQSQSALRGWLDAQGIAYTPFWLVNMVEIKGDRALVEALRRRPEINRLVLNPSIASAQLAHDETNRRGVAWAAATWWPRWSANHAAPAAPAELPYGLTMTGADQVWALGFRGEGIVVGGQDTGIDWEHPALLQQYRGYITATGTVTHVLNWFDAYGLGGRPVTCAFDAQVPCDDDSHGTHTIGTVLGDATTITDVFGGGAIIGMAPGAQWIGCRNMRNGVGEPASYTACFEFMLAPYPQGGDKMTEGHPELAADITNNSWGCPPSEGCDAASLQQIVETARAAGMFVAASAGNSGPGCSSIDDPIGLYDAAFTVGAHSDSGEIAGFSSRGAVTVDGSNRPKPDLSAPGVSTLSALPGGGFGFKSGTSMASPHVAGAVALLWSAAPALRGNIDLTEQVLTDSATAVIDLSCGGSEDGVPNNVYGYGRLNVKRAVGLALGEGAVVTVTVPPSNANATAGAVVVLSSLTRAGYEITATLDAQGIALWSVAAGNPVPLGSYELALQSVALVRQAIEVELGANEFLFDPQVNWLPFVTQHDGSEQRR